MVNKQKTRQVVEAPPPSGRVAQKRAAMKRDIVDAARELLRGVSPAELTFEAVAQRLSLTKPALFHYFDSKAALLFEVALEELAGMSQRMHEAAAAAPDGPAALEALIRAMASHFHGRIDAFRVVQQGLALEETVRFARPEELARIRPLNDLAYGAATGKLLADMRAGRIPRRPNPRRLVFSAFLAGFGLLSMKAMVEGVNDPLGYSDQSLIQELCVAFRCATKGGTR